MYVYDQLLIVNHQLACWPHLVWMLGHSCFGRSWGAMWWLYCELRGHISSVYHGQTIVSHKNNKTSKKTFFWRQKCFYWHWLCIYILWLAKEPSSSNWQITSARKECLVCFWCIPVHRSYWCCVTLHFICWGTECQCILMRLTEQKLVVAMARQDLKKLVCALMYQQWITHVIL